MGKFASAATRVAGKAALEGTAAGGVALAQTGDLKKAAEVGGTTAALSGAIRTVGEAARALGIPEYLYSKIFKNNYRDMRAGMNAEGLAELQKTNPQKFAQYVESGIIKVGKDGNPIVNETLAKEALNRGLSGNLKTMANATVEGLADSEHAVRQTAKNFTEQIKIPDHNPLIKVLNRVASEYEGVGSGELSQKAENLANVLKEMEAISLESRHSKPVVYSTLFASNLHTDNQLRTFR
jgi:hypothetical protein